MDATELAYAGPARQAELVRSGEVTPRDLVELTLRRIERLDPQLNAFRKVLGEKALVEADQALARVRSGDERPLLGVPVAIKDDTAVAGEVRTYGSNAYGSPESEDAEIVKRLRAAGAIVVGITTCSELSIWPQTETPTFGITRNPWDPQRTPGGSSGGSAAAVAAGIVSVATAADGGGSIRIPAACCGLPGLKPQRDRIPTYAVGEGWNGLSAVGVLCRTVADTAYVYEALTGLPYRAAAGRQPLRLRVAVVRNMAPLLMGKVAPEVHEALNDTAELLRTLGHEVVDGELDYGQTSPRFFVRWASGVAQDAAAMAHPERLEPKTRTLTRIGRTLGGRALAWACDGAGADRPRLTALFSEGADVLLSPTIPFEPRPVGAFVHGSYPRAQDVAGRTVPFTVPWNHVGNPAMSVPAGVFASGLPRAVQLVAPANGEEVLLSLAAQLEGARPWADRRPPL